MRSMTTLKMLKSWLIWTKERVATFYDVLKKNGVNCVVRQEHGTDIDAACGQLRSNTMKRDRQKAVAEASGKSEGK